MSVDSTIAKLDQHIEENSFVVDEIGDFLQRNIPPREHILAPWLPTQGLAMVYAARGVGKTFFALNVAYAAAGGGAFLKWTAPKPRGVLYIDGEMPAIAMQERLSTIVTTADYEPYAPFRILTPDIQRSKAPNLANVTDIVEIERHLDGIDLIVVDNISTLITGNGKENDEESWRPAQDWLLRQRAQGRSVLLVHHAGKGGQQRGTSKREDVLDTVIKLKHPAQYEPEEGAKFEVHFEKSRGFYGDEAKSVTAWLDQAGFWNHRDLTESTFDQVVNLHREDLTPGEIAAELEINKSTVSRHLKKARHAGLISKN